jgi:serine/threonine-protein kinase
VIRQVGKGGFGAIYLVEDTAVQEELILKILNPQLSSDETALRRFVQELKLTRAITHGNVIRIYDLLDLKGAHAVSMEYFPSKDLGKVIRSQGSLDALRTLRIAIQTCEGLAAAHGEGVIHRDMKPANILVGEQDAVKIVDFGLAAAEQQLGSRLTKSGLLIGTPEYMAPEQISGGEVDHRADIYSVGILLYEMLSGKKPFTADTPVKILFQHLEGEAEPLGRLVEGLPLDLEYLVTCSMARDPDDRPRTAGDLLEMLHRVRSDLEKAA